MIERIAITGASSGIGSAVLARLVECGVATVSFDLQPPADIPKGSPFVEMDVSDNVAVEQAVLTVEQEVGPLTGLVHAAGILGKVHGPDRLDVSDWKREIDVDLTGTYNVNRAIGSRLAMRGKGSIVNVASVAGMTSAPAHAYAAAKAGVISLTRSLARAWGRSGVRVNAVSPGFTITPALQAGMAAGVLDPIHMAEASALGRMLEPAEVAAAIVWLLGPESSGVTGVNLPVDAGFLAGATWGAYKPGT